MTKFKIGDNIIHRAPKNNFETINKLVPRKFKIINIYEDSYELKYINNSIGINSFYHVDFIDRNYTISLKDKLTKL